MLHVCLFVVFHSEKHSKYDTQSTGRSVLSNRNRIVIEVQKLFKRPKMNLQKIEDAVMSLTGTYG